MPDITMCNGLAIADGEVDCPLRHKCYRHNAVPGRWQSFFVHMPYKEGECEHYWEDSDAVSKASGAARSSDSSER